MKMSIPTGFASIPPQEFIRRVETIPLPSKLKSKLTSTFSKWIACSGPEWAVGRIKEFKNCILQSYSTGKPVNPEWFATTQTGRLRGVFGSLQRIALESPEKLKAVLNLLGMASAIYRESLTPSIMEDIRKNVTAPPAVKRPHETRGVLSRRSVGMALKQLGWHRSVQCGRPVPLLQVLPGKQSHARAIRNDLAEIMDSWIWTEFRTELEHTVGAEVSSELRLHCPRPPLPPNQWEFQPLVGMVNVTHEPGLKTRYFAAPNVVLQRALEPLKVSLMSLLRKVPWDCTLNQRKADGVIQAALNRGQTVHSVDMSSATDHFPWFFQEWVLKSLTKNTGTTARAVQLLCDMVNKGGWLLPDKQPGRWTKGQPLGLGPSFPLFTFTHGLLLFLLNGRRWDKAWYVLGDDVVILDDTLNSKYRKVLRDWEVPVSELKSISSCRLAQFAGVTYTPTKHFWVPKWRQITRETILDLQAWWYPGLTKGMKDATLIEWVLSLPEPYGIGRNPNGVPLSVRFSDRLVEELISLEQAREDSPRRVQTRVSLRNLTEAMSGSPEGHIAANVRLFNVRPEWRKGRIPTGIPLRFLDTDLLDRTEIPGFPRTRLSPRPVDPYSIGNLRRWKRLRSLASGPSGL